MPYNPPPPPAPPPTLVPFWYDDGEDAWNTCVLGGYQLPGLAKVTVKKARKIDIKRPPGAHGATLTDQGYDPAEVTISVDLWTAQQWETWQYAQASLHPPPGKKTAQPIDILHPEATLFNVTSILIKSIEGPDEDTSRRGLRVMKIQAVEYFPPSKKSVTTTPQNSIPAFTNPLTVQSSTAGGPSSKGQGAANPNK